MKSINLKLTSELYAAVASLGGKVNPTIEGLLREHKKVRAAALALGLTFVPRVDNRGKRKAVKNKSD